MRLAKYAQRGYDIFVPDLDKSRVDPFWYEKHFDQAQGLAQLLLLEKVKTLERGCVIGLDDSSRGALDMQMIGDYKQSCTR
eukprot:3264618-Ditylum_brightwellii.AAC.2